MPRQYQRYPITLEVVISFASGKRDARISDLSIGGCFIDSILEVSKGTITEVDLHLPTGEWLKLSGEIVYSMSRIGYGIRFINLTDEQRFLLEQTIFVYGGQPYAQADSTDE